jgi:hypothetical protein
VSQTDKPAFVQHHHRSYDPPVIEKVFKGEHFLLTRMKMFTRKKVSWGFLRSLTYFVKENEDRAIELE